MANIVDGFSQLETTVRLFDDYNKFDLVVDANQYDIVHSFFSNLVGSPDAANNFTIMIFRIATLSGENPINLINYLSGKSTMEVNTVIAYYLNSVKSKTSLYGVSAVPQPNKNVQRNILA